MRIEQLLGKAAGNIATVEPDYIVINDGISSGAVDMISKVAYPSRLFVIFDHDVPTGTPESAMVFRKINKFSNKHGAEFVQAKGVGYSWLLADKVEKGQIIITGGSHSSIFGAKDALGINVSNTELAKIIETGKYSTIVPQTICVQIVGNLAEGVSMIDAGLHFLNGNGNLQGKAIEFSSENMDLHEKATLCSMACGTGAYSALFTEKPERQPDIVLNLSEVVPMIMLPCPSRSEQGNAAIACAAMLDNKKIHAGQIGGYTGGSIEDLRLAAKISEAGKLALGFRLTVCPATGADYIAAMEDGTLEKLIDYGAQIHAVGDHSVNKQGAGVIGSGERLLTTGLYTFTGCMGCDDSEVYTASVQTIMNAGMKVIEP